MTRPDRIAKGLYWDRAWSLVGGCTPVSEGCRRCWAAQEAHMRASNPNAKVRAANQDLTERSPAGPPRFNGAVICWCDLLGLPLRVATPTVWAIWTDLFHKAVPDAFVANAWYVMGQADWHTYLVLTKRPARMAAWLDRWCDTAADRTVQDTKFGLPPMPRGPEDMRRVYTSGRAAAFAEMLESWDKAPEGAAYPTYDWALGPRWWPDALPNVWLGVTAEDQAAADARIPLLLGTPAAKRWVSIEPMLGPVDIGTFIGIDCAVCGGRALVADDDPQCRTRWCDDCGAEDNQSRLDWVVCGGETGVGARPVHPDWVRDLRDQCQEAGVPFFFKGWGEWLPESQMEQSLFDECADRWPVPETSRNHVALADGDDDGVLFRVGRKRAGRLLDGREWNEGPR